MADFNALLASMYPIRLSDEEILRLATLSKLRTEIDSRQLEVEQGTYYLHMKFMFKVIVFHFDLSFISIFQFDLN